jgi:hypothetical protein
MRLEKVKLTFACRRTALAEAMFQSATPPAWPQMKEAAHEAAYSPRQRSKGGSFERSEAYSMTSLARSFV